MIKRPNHFASQTNVEKRNEYLEPIDGLRGEEEIEEISLLYHG
jgi:hypothetical protein